MAKYFAILPAIFAFTYAATAGETGPLDSLNVMNLGSPQSAIISAIVFNALIIPLLVPLALRQEGYGSSTIGRALMVYFILVTAANPVASWLSDRFGWNRRLVAIGGLSIAAGGLAGLVGGPPALIAGVVAVILLYSLLQMFRAANPVILARAIKIGGGVVASALVPFFSEHIAKGEEDKAWRSFSAILTALLLGLALLVGAMVLLVPYLVEVFVPSSAFAPEHQRAWVEMTRIMMPAQIFFVTGGLFMGVLNAYQHFWAPAVGPTVYNLVVIGGIMILSLIHI